MAIVQMTKSISYGADSNEGNDSWEFTQSLTGAGDTNIVLIPVNRNKINCSVYPAGGATGKVQYTFDTVSVVENGTPTWFDWPSGAVAVNTEDTLIAHATAVKAVQAGAGTLKFNVII